MSDVAAVLERGWGYRGPLEAIGAGRINDTWRVPADGVVLQRINPRVFERPLEVMTNVARVVAHINTFAPGWVPELLPTLEGRWYARANGEIYRLWRFVEGVPRFDDAILFHAGFAFGRTERLLEGLPGPRLPDTIEGFLRLPRFLDRLDALVAGRALDHDVHALVAALGAHRDLAAVFTDPTGYIHGDCKLGNLLFDDAGKVVAVLDLDTVMWGHWAWDFGDLARSGANRDGRFALDRFAALARGFLAGAWPPGTECVADPAALADAPAYVAAILTTRYLIDHLEGDVHFKVERRGDNLTRARIQLGVLSSMRTDRDAMLRVAGVALKAQ